MRTALVFDNVLWNGKDVGDNSQFWKEADILEIHHNDGGKVASVRFHHDGRTSHGHFTSAMNHHRGL